MTIPRCQSWVIRNHRHVQCALAHGHQSVVGLQLHEGAWDGSDYTVKWTDDDAGKAARVDTKDLS